MYVSREASRIQPVVTVSELTSAIRDLLEEAFTPVAVVGEVSNAKLYPSGHWYFSLKDQDATLSCVCFKTANASIKFKIEDGLMVVARGRLSVYPPRGSYQMVVTTLEPVGVGEWQLAFDQLRSKLEQEGLLSAERKRPIPILPRKIGIATSTAGAALRDMLHTLNRRNRSVHVIISPCKVQGDGSPDEIARAINYLESDPYIDVILVARGGGSIEDLWAFNTETVARAVASCRVPIISGVGHETDVTICDLVADVRAPTPTAAAELVARGSAELLEKWSNLNKRLNYIINDRLINARRRVERMSPFNALIRQQERLKQLHLKVQLSRSHLLKKMSARLTDARHRWEQSTEKLQALGPKNVLSRGFAIIRKCDSTIIRSFDEVSSGETLEALLHSGKLVLKVESAQAEWSDTLLNQEVTNNGSTG
ncbi:MAG TPA: exodeoxyribonuclease VII large subunit [Candidatus Obscuribacterales bacterium]